MKSFKTNLHHDKNDNDPPGPLCFSFHLEHEEEPAALCHVVQFVVHDGNNAAGRRGADSQPRIFFQRWLTSRDQESPISP